MQSQASIIGQALDREEDWWLRREVERGNDNLFLFGPSELFGRPCIQIQRLRKNVVTAILKWKKSMPSAAANYSPVPLRREVCNLVRHYLLGKERLLTGLADLKPHCLGSFQISMRTAMRCAALLLHDDSPELKPKIQEEWGKILSYHPNVLGDTQHIHNALYFDAALVTKDRGLQKMADYCGLKWVN